TPTGLIMGVEKDNKGNSFNHYGLMINNNFFLKTFNIQILPTFSIEVSEQDAHTPNSELRTPNSELRTPNSDHLAKDSLQGTIDRSDY
ncbi:hypothetical protein, partial [Crocosphaera watsonii]|uniref:hypothetical protein n=1 Tax=Crocosphaera watsonii TaxID=263511 RepID=UPI000564BEC4